jgi:transcriptional regulatory protein GAL4
MGVASGAALLRLADDSADSGVEMDNNNEDHVGQDTPPIPNVIFSLSQLEPFVEAYFQTYHVSYPIVHEATFKAQFMEVVPRPKGKAWQVLLHIIAALGSFGSSMTTPEVDVALFEAAKARMSIDMLETGNIVLVQALTLISNYVQKRNKPNSGYNYLGLAKRMAMGIGLHKEFPAWHSHPMRLETRRRVYWCLYVFDVGATITFSRPLDLPQDGIEIQLPLNVADSDITINTKRYPNELQETTLYTHVRCQAQFHLATSGIYAKLISTPFPTAEVMLQADDSHLVKWLQELPSYYREGASVAAKYQLSHSILQWRWRNFRILMYRPFLMRRFMTKNRSALPTSTAEDSAIQRCLEAAAESIQLITSYWQQGNQNVLACWYSLYFLFQAVSLYLSLST